MKRVITLALLPLFALTLACGKKATTAATTSGSSGGGSTPFTAAQIAQAWVSDCTASTDPILGSSYYKNYLTLNSDGTFMFQTYLHNGGGGSNCNNANYIAVTTIYGAYSVGSVISGSTQVISFAVVVSGGTAPDMMIIDSFNHTPTVTQIENAFNGDCGGTSPYCTLSMGSCTNNGTYSSGQHAATKNMSCMHYTFPNTGNSTIYNVATYSGGVLTLGSGVFGVPGVFSVGSLPTTADVAYH